MNSLENIINTQIRFTKNKTFLNHKAKEQIEKNSHKYKNENPTTNQIERNIVQDNIIKDIC